jgi:hypothetical protein
VGRLPYNKTSESRICERDWYYSRSPPERPGSIKIDTSIIEVEMDRQRDNHKNPLGYSLFNFSI